MRPFFPPGVRRALAAVLCVTAAAVVLLAAPATADDVAVAPDSGNSAVVSRLSISNGKGWLTLHMRSSTADTFEVFVPAGHGSWGGKSDVYLPEQDAHCRLVPGRALYYVCRPGAYGFPSGSYAVSIPVTRTGSVEGMTGRARADVGPHLGYADTFPVLGGLHYRSTAEVRNAPVRREASSVEGRATLSVTTTIVPGEAITALDITPPTVGGTWRIIGSNIANHGVRCITTRNLDGAILHCTPSAGSASGLPAGRYQLVFDLGFHGVETVEYSQVSLTAAGLCPEVVDTFAWVNG